jgi:type VI secretion system protein ImpM
VSAELPGWHGKLPAIGDFASRRLDADFIAAWDDWLAAGLEALHVQPGWLDAYLDSASWRFALMPGVLPGGAGARGWIGVLVPSVDRYGRYYPLTVAAALDALPAGGHAFDALWRWLEQVEATAVDALHGDWPLERFESELARVGAAPAPTAPGAPLGDDAIVDIALDGSDVGAWIEAQAGAAWRAAMTGRALWYANGAPRLVATRGLPAGLVARLFGGVSHAFEAAR